MKECEGHLGHAKFDHILKEVYGNIPCRGIDSDSSSSGSLGILMEMARSLIDKEVLSYDHNIIDGSDISKLCSTKQISSTENEKDVVMEPCVVGERVWITQPMGVSNKYFYFYLGVIEDFRIRIPFTDFESDLLKTLNVAPSQLHPNGWGFIKDFELVCEEVSIIDTLGLFFYFFKLKGTDKGVPGFPLRESQGNVSSRLILPTIKVSSIISFG